MMKYISFGILFIVILLLLFIGIKTIQKPKEMGVQVIKTSVVPRQANSPHVDLLIDKKSVKVTNKKVTVKGEIVVSHNYQYDTTISIDLVPKSKYYIGMFVYPYKDNFIFFPTFSRDYSFWGLSINTGISLIGFTLTVPFNITDNTRLNLGLLYPFGKDLSIVGGISIGL